MFKYVFSFGLEAGEDFYEGIPGESFESEPALLNAAPSKFKDFCFYKAIKVVLQASLWDRGYDKFKSNLNFL